MLKLTAGPGARRLEPAIAGALIGARQTRSASGTKSGFQPATSPVNGISLPEGKCFTAPSGNRTFLLHFRQTPMGNLKKKRRLKMAKHKRRKRLKANRHKKRTWQK